MNLVAVQTLSPLELCDQGQYAAAGEMAGLRAGEWPKRGSEGDSAHAYALLVAGIITSVAGGIQQSGDLAVAKEMLAESIRLFGDDPRSLLARYRLARTEYWDGQLDKALEMVASLLAQDLDSPTRFRTLMLRAGIYCDQGLPEQAFADTEQMAGIYDDQDNLLKGQFHNQRGRTLRLLGETDRAIVDYDSAIHFFKEANDVRCEAIAANNLAGVYIETKQFTEAHEYVERAIGLFRVLGDKTLEAESLDQEALIFLAEGKLDEAKESITKAMELIVLRGTLRNFHGTCEKINRGLGLESLRDHGTLSHTGSPSLNAANGGNPVMTPIECAAQLIQNPDNAAVLYDLVIFARMPSDPEHDAEMDGVEEMLFSKTQECIDRREEYRRSRLIRPISDS